MATLAEIRNDVELEIERVDAYLKELQAFERALYVKHDEKFEAWLKSFDPTRS